MENIKLISFLLLSLLLIPNLSSSPVQRALIIILRVLFTTYPNISGATYHTLLPLLSLSFTQRISH
jgi:hypothetical protein